MSDNDLNISIMFRAMLVVLLFDIYVHVAGIGGSIRWIADALFLGCGNAITVWVELDLRPMRARWFAVVAEAERQQATARSAHAPAAPPAAH